MVDVQARIQELRSMAGLTVVGAAEKIGASRQQWEQWETGIRNPGLRSLKRIANALDCSLADLVSEPAEVLSDNH